VNHLPNPDGFGGGVEFAEWLPNQELILSYTHIRNVYRKSAQDAITRHTTPFSLQLRTPTLGGEYRQTDGVAGRARDGVSEYSFLIAEGALHQATQLRDLYILQTRTWRRAGVSSVHRHEVSRLFMSGDGLADAETNRFKVAYNQQEALRDGDVGAFLKINKKEDGLTIDVRGGDQYVDFLRADIPSIHLPRHIADMANEELISRHKALKHTTQKLAPMLHYLSQPIFWRPQDGM
jgi:hypothetical protein